MTSIESEFSVAIDLFEDLKSSECGHRLEIDYYAKVKEMEFVVHCNRYSCLCSIRIVCFSLVIVRKRKGDPPFPEEWKVHLLKRCQSKYSASSR